MKNSFIDAGGSSRSFSAFLGKDLLVEYYKEVGLISGCLPERIKQDFLYFAEVAHEYIIQDLKKPITIKQSDKIYSILDEGKIPDERAKFIRSKLNSMTMEEASDIIDNLLQGLPPEYQDGVTYAQRDIMKATANRTARE